MRGKWELCSDCDGDGVVGMDDPCPTCGGLRVIHWARHAVAWEVVAARAGQEGNVVVPIREWTAEQWPALMREADRYGLYLTLQQGEVGLTVMAHRKPAAVRSAA